MTSSSITYGASDHEFSSTRPRRLAPAAALLLLAALPLSDPGNPHRDLSQLPGSGDAGDSDTLGAGVSGDGPADHGSDGRNGLAAVRSPGDNLGDLASAATDVINRRHPRDLEFGARQEFAEAADINEILRKFGVPVPRPLVFGDVDYSIDLTRAHVAVRELHAAVDALSPETLDRLGGRQAVIRGIADGTITTLEEPAPTVAGTAGSDAGAVAAVPAPAQ